MSMRMNSIRTTIFWAAATESARPHASAEWNYKESDDVTDL
jgi:hypothetical protein